MASKSKSWTARRIHLWIGIILAIPMALMAITGSLISMRSIGNIDVPMSWLGSESIPEHLPITAYLETSDGAIWLGNAQGLSQIKDQQITPVGHFASGLTGQCYADCRHQNGGLVTSRWAMEELVKRPCSSIVDLSQWSSIGDCGWSWRYGRR
jgi:hypothetical protein